MDPLCATLDNTHTTTTVDVNIYNGILKGIYDRTNLHLGSTQGLKSFPLCYALWRAYKYALRTMWALLHQDMGIQGVPRAHARAHACTHARTHTHTHTCFMLHACGRTTPEREPTTRCPGKSLFPRGKPLSDLPPVAPPRAPEIPPSHPEGNRVSHDPCAGLRYVLRLLK